MKRYLLDTNHLGEAIGKCFRRPRSHSAVAPARKCIRFTCGPVLCELFVGVYLRKDAAKARKRLDRILQVVRIWPIEVSIADQYANAYHELQKAGRALSQVDIMLAALARHAAATLLTTDNDFRALRDIQTENWLAP